MKIAICPGSFDPITLGHLNIIRRTSNIFDEVVVLVMVNMSKQSPMFTHEERVTLIKKCVSRFENVRVESYNGLLAEYTKRYESPVVVKGLRANTDFENEFQMAQINKSINPALDTMFLTSDVKYTFMSSSMVRELAAHGAKLEEFVPYEILEELAKRAKGEEE